MREIVRDQARYGKAQRRKQTEQRRRKLDTSTVKRRILAIVEDQFAGSIAAYDIGIVIWQLHCYGALKRAKPTDRNLALIRQALSELVREEALVRVSGPCGELEFARVQVALQPVRPSLIEVMEEHGLPAVLQPAQLTQVVAWGAA